MNDIFAAGLNYKTAPLAIREQFAVPSCGQQRAALRLRSLCGLDEVVLLWTCNRVEIYGVRRAGRPDVEEMMMCLVNAPPPPGASLYLHEGAAAARHLFSVASGMDSMVLGETEITGQVKNAYEKARQDGLTGGALNRLFQKALETAKEVRTRTAIGKGAASVGSVAVQHAQKVFGAALTGREVMVIGAGDMAEKCLRHLMKKGVESVTVVNRSLDRAGALAAKFGGRAISFAQCVEAISRVDIVITSTGSPHIILEKSDIELAMRGREERPLVIVDIAVPRDVAPEAREVRGAHLHDIGDLEGTVRESIRYREQDLALCWKIIGEKVEELEERFAVAASACA